MRTIDEKPEIWPFILISLLLHAVFIFIMMKFAAAPDFEEQVVEVVPIFEDSPRGRQKIADIDEPDIERVPEKPNFLGRYSSRVPEEQVATGQVSSGGRGKRGTGKEELGKESKKARKEQIPKKDLFAFDKRIFDKNSGRTTGSDDFGGAPSGDFFPDFKRGNKTYLNVLRYPDVDYFVRLKRAFRITFNPVPALQSHFSFNRVSRGTVDVVLGVSVDRAGALAETFVFKSSGIPTYDEEALRTVRASAPFSSPPEKFLENDGVLRMSWTFTVYL